MPDIGYDPNTLSVNSGADQPPAVQPPLADPNAPAPQIPAAPDTSGLPASSQVNAAPQPTAAPPSGGVWKSVVVGALKGIESHLAGAAKGFVQQGIPGAIGGAIDPAQAEARRQQQMAHIKFQDPASAEQVARARYYDAHTSQLPKEMQDKAAARDQDMVKYLMGIGLTPTVVADNHSDGAMAGLQQAADAGGGAVPPLSIFHLGDKLVAFDLGAMNANSAILRQANDVGKIVGRPDLTPAMWAKIPTGQKNKILDEATHFFNPVFPGSDKVDGVIQQYKNYLAKVNLDPNFADKANTVAKLKDAVSGLQQAKQANQQSKIEVAAARGAALNATRPVNAIDSQGNAIITTAANAEKHGMAPVGAGQKAMGQIGQFNEIESASLKARAAIQALPDQRLSAQAVAFMTQAAKTNDESIVGNIVSGEATQRLSPAERDLVIWFAQLNERSLSLRNVAGMGQGAQDLRKAIQNTLPSLKSGDKKMMGKQLDAFDNQVAQLKKGIVGVKGVNDRGAKEIHYKVVNGQLVAQ